MCLQKPPFVYLTSEEEAKDALALIASFIERQIIANNQPVIFQGTKPAVCAVVGGAPIPRQKSTAEQARLVEEADVVIRLNIRYPSFLRAERSGVALGSTTHMLIVQRGALHSFKRFAFGWGQGNATFGDIRRQAIDYLKKEAPVFVYRHECPGRFRACVMGWKAFNDSATVPVSGIHLIHPDLEATAYRLLEQHKQSAGYSVPTTGMIGILMALRSCERVRLFAMNGTIGGTGANGGSVWRGHDLRAERSFIRALERCAPGIDPYFCGRTKIFS